MHTSSTYRLRRTICRILLLVVLAFGTACRHSPAVSPAKKPEPPPLYQWNGGHLSGPLRITIDLSEQRARFQRGGKPAGWTYVATGKSGHGTKTGRFHVSEKVRDKVSTMWGQIVNSHGVVVVEDAKAGRDGGGRFVGAPMPYWMRIYGAVGMHAGFIPDPGHTASHGCIRLPSGIAEIVFDIVKIGTPVTITP